MKKILISLLFVIGLFFTTLFAIPYFYDINQKLRPIVLKVIRDNVDANVELGSFSLNLLSGVRVGISSFLLKGKTTNETYARIENAEVFIPYSAILYGKIKAKLIAKKPELTIVRRADGSFNILRILKKEEEPAQGTQSDTPAKDNMIAAAISRLELSVSLREAQVQFLDQATHGTYNIQSLNFDAEDIGFNKKTRMNLQTNISVNDSKGIFIEGQTQYKGEVFLSVSSAGFEKATIDANLNLRALEIRYGKIFHKTKGVDLDFGTKFTATKENVIIKKAQLRFQNLSADISGQVTNLQETPESKINIKIKEFDLGQLQKTMGAIKEFQIQGRLFADVNILGTQANPTLSGQIGFLKGQVRAPVMTSPITDIQTQIDFSNRGAQIRQGSFLIGEDKISITGSLQNFKAPRVALRVSASKIDFNKILDSEKQSEKLKNIATPAPQGAILQAALAPIAAIREVSGLHIMDLALETNLQKITYQNYTIENFDGLLESKNLFVTLKKLKMKIFNGDIFATAKIDLPIPKPTYQAQIEVKNLDTDLVIKNQFPEFSKSLTGFASGQISLEGTGIKENEVLKNLHGSAKLNVIKGTWSGAKALKAIGEKLSGISGATEALGKIQVGDRFKTLAAEISIQDEKLIIKRSRADMEETGASIEAAGMVGFDKRLSLEGNLFVKLKDVPKDIRAADGRAQIPFEISGKADAPEVDWQKTLRVVGKAYAKDEGRKIINKEIDKLKDKVLKDENIKKLFKGLKF